MNKYILTGLSGFTIFVFIIHPLLQENTLSNNDFNQNIVNSIFWIFLCVGFPIFFQYISTVLKKRK